MLRTKFSFLGGFNTWDSRYLVCMIRLFLGFTLRIMPSSAPEFKLILSFALKITSDFSVGPESNLNVGRLIA